MDAPANRRWTIAAARFLLLSHRWLGIPLSLVALMWFVSGIAMIYAGGMPRLTPQARLDHLPMLDLGQVKLTPSQATVPLGGEEAFPGAPVLLTVQGRPAYRFPYADNATVYADDGSLLIPLGEQDARRVAEQFMRVPAPDIELLGRLDRPDQWTLATRGLFPLYRFAANDTLGTQLYVSTVTGEVIQATTRRERALAWLSTIPHWLYFSTLRQDQTLWYRLVVGLASGVCLLAALGLLLAFMQWRRARRIPHRGGLRWHFVAGAVFGLFVITWGFSGILSMEPWSWTDVPELHVSPEALTGGEPDLAAYGGVDVDGLAALVAPRFIKAVTFDRIHGDHYLTLQTSAHADAMTLPLERLHAPYDVAGRAQMGQVLVSAATTLRHDRPFDGDAIVARLRAALPGANIVAQELLLHYDDYYYSRSGQSPLPVLRVKLDDPLRTWLYIDPLRSRIVANVHRYSRAERWLYHGLHSLDFRFWYAKRPLWDLVMLTLLLGGTLTSALGLWFGIRRLS